MRIGDEVVAQHFHGALLRLRLVESVSLGIARAREGGIEVEARRGVDGQPRGDLVDLLVGMFVGALEALRLRRQEFGMILDRRHVGVDPRRRRHEVVHRGGRRGCHRRSRSRRHAIVGGRGFLLGDLKRIDAIQHANDRLLHRLQHAGVVLVVVAALVDEILEHAAHFADVARLDVVDIALDEVGGGALRCRVGEILIVDVARRAAADETREALVGKLYGDHAQLRVDGVEAAGVGGYLHAIVEETRQALVGKLRGQRAKVRVDAVETRQLAAELTELVADLVDLPLGGAQLVEIGTRRHVAKHRVQLRLERIEAASERQHGILRSHAG